MLASIFCVLVSNVKKFYANSRIPRENTQSDSHRGSSDGTIGGAFLMDDCLASLLQVTCSNCTYLN